MDIKKLNEIRVKEKKIQVTITLEPKVWDDLNDLKKKKKLKSASFIINQLIKELLKDQNKSGDNKD